MSNAESAINAIKKKADMMNAYADVLENLKSQERWYMHTDEETEELVDDEGEYAENHLTAIRNSIAAIKKVAGV